MITLQRQWYKNLNKLFRETENELTISSPYISNVGAEFLLNNISKSFNKNGSLKFITDLSPKNIYQSSTDPKSFKLFFDSLNSVRIFHLPKLHAKVYISDNKNAIVTSGNLTAGGLFNNFEYGIGIDQIESVSAIKIDLIEYGNLGAEITRTEIEKYCTISNEITELYKQRERTIKKQIEVKLFNAIDRADTELIKAKLAFGPPHSVFEKTIKYLLKRNDGLPTSILHNFIQEIHPDLCDDTVDRVINGIHFGKKWKHAVRTAQQNLKKKGIIELKDGLWRLLKSS